VSPIRLPHLAGGLVLILSIAFVHSAVSASLPSHDGAPAAPQDGDMELGAEVFATQCEPCHGPQGKGDGPAARFLETRPRDLTGGQWLYVKDVTVEHVAALVREGVPDTEMEPFGELLLDEEMTAVAAYVIARFVSPESQFPRP